MEQQKQNIHIILFALSTPNEFDTSVSTLSSSISIPQKPPCPQVSTSHSNSKRASSHLARPSAPATGRRHLIHRLLPRLIASLGLVLGRCTSYISFHSLMDIHTHILTYTFYRQYNFMICQDILNHLKCASHFQQPKAKTSTEPFTYH